MSSIYRVNSWPASDYIVMVCVASLRVYSIELIVKICLVTSRPRVDSIELIVMVCVVTSRPIVYSIELIVMVVYSLAGQ